MKNDPIWRVTILYTHRVNHKPVFEVTIKRRSTFYIGVLETGKIGTWIKLQMGWKSTLDLSNRLSELGFIQWAHVCPAGVELVYDSTECDTYMKESYHD